jgi:rhodanese-related sulfurtransferase
VVVDLRSEITLRVEGRKVRGAIHIAPSQFEKRYKEIPPGRPIVMYCT